MTTSILLCRSLHFFDESDEETTALYLLVVDSLNFCFWPDHTQPPSAPATAIATGIDGCLEYEHLSLGLRASVLRDRGCISPHSLAVMQDVSELIGWSRPMPLAAERARLLREVGRGLLQYYGGSAVQLIRAAGGSACRLVDLVTQAFPGFRDHAVYQGEQVFFYKRAQIFAGDGTY